jgi:hypothetical protein
MNFTDVHTTDWFHDFVQCLYCRGAISGYSDGTFRPNNDTIRGQMTKIVVLAFGYTLRSGASPTYTDVPTSNPFYIYVETATYYNIVNGYDDHTFRPFNNVTRGQLSKIVVQGAHWNLINPAVPTFSDVPVGHPFYAYIETAYCHQIIDGYADTTFRSDKYATRAQISKIVCLATQNLPPCSSDAAPLDK